MRLPSGLVGRQNTVPARLCESLEANFQTICPSHSSWLEATTGVLLGDLGTAKAKGRGQLQCSDKAAEGKAEICNGAKSPGTRQLTSAAGAQPKGVRGEEGLRTTRLLSRFLNQEGNGSRVARGLRSRRELRK